MSSIPPPTSAQPPGPTAPPPPPERLPEPARGPDEPPWPVWTAPAAVGMGIVLGVFGTILVQGIGAAGGSSISNPSPAVTIISAVVFDLGFVAAALYFAVVRGHGHPADFGFRPVALKLAVVAIVIAAVSYYTATAIWAALFNLHGSDKLPSDFGVDRSTLGLIGTAAFVCVIAPRAEEFFFRGFFFGALRRWRIKVAGREIGVWVAAVVTGILFGLAHTGSASPQYLVPLGFLGFVLCIVRWRTGSLYPCMALHSINNSLALGVNQVSWNAGEVFALMAASLLVIGAITLPLSARVPALRWGSCAVGGCGRRGQAQAEDLANSTGGDHSGSGQGRDESVSARRVLRLAPARHRSQPGDPRWWRRAALRAGPVGQRQGVPRVSPGQDRSAADQALE